MGWQVVKVVAWVDEGAPPSVGGPPGIWGGGNVPMPNPPIANVPGAPGWSPPSGGGEGPPGIWGGGNVPMPTPPIANVPGAPGYGPPGIWGPTDPRPTPPIAMPGPPVDPGYGVPEGGRPIVSPPIYYPPEIWPTPPGLVDPGYGVPLPPGVPAHPIVLPPPGGGGEHPEHPIYWPPVIWPDPPEGLPSFDPDQIPQHPDLPDLNYGVWYWIEDGAEIKRAFIAQVVRVSIDPPGYEPKDPSEAQQPGEWMVCLLNAQRPAWAWVPSSAAPELPEPPSDAHPDHTLPGDLPHPDQGLPGEPPHPAHLPAR